MCCPFDVRPSTSHFAVSVALFRAVLAKGLSQLLRYGLFCFSAFIVLDYSSQGALDSELQGKGCACVGRGGWRNLLIVN